jgi:WD40 repeat protein
LCHYEKLICNNLAESKTILRYCLVSLAILFAAGFRSADAKPASEPSEGPQYPFIPALTFAREGEVLVWGETAGNNRDRCRLAWCNSRSGKPLKSINGFESFGFSHGSVAVSKDGRFLAATPFPDGVRIWDIQNEERLILAEKPLNSTALAFVPTDNTLLVKYAKEIVAYDVPSLQRKGTFQKTFTGRVFGGAPQSQSIAVSADGKRLAGFFNGVRLWDVTTGKQLAEIQGPTDEFKRVAISSDGNLVAYSTRGPTRVWDYRQQAERFSLEGKFLDLTVAFSPTEAFWRSAAGSSDCISSTRRPVKSSADLPNSRSAPILSHSRRTASGSRPPRGAKSRSSSSIQRRRS